MPKYEVGYILSSSLSDDEIPGVAAQVTQIVEGVGGKILNEDHVGRKKLAYPIGRTRNGYYAFITADIAGDKVQEIEHKLNTTDSVIRFIIVNMEDADKRLAKDEAIRAARPQMAGTPEEGSDAVKPEAAPQPAAELDEKIDEAISGQ
jgi:small subunit ribosomal protein S6